MATLPLTLDVMCFGLLFGLLCLGVLVAVVCSKTS
jgi:hypothetical protein